MTDPTPGAEGYWSEIEEAAAADGGDVAPSAAELLEEAHDELEEPEAMLGAVATGEEDGLLYCLTLSRKVRDGHLIVTQRYASVDPEEGTATLSSSNRLRMRVQGSLTSALRVMTAMLDDGALSDENPQLMDARNAEGLDQAGNVLKAPVGESGTVEADPGADEDERPAGDGTSKSASESVEDRKHQAQRNGYQCEQCGQVGAPDEMKNLGGALGKDHWVHAEMCPEDREDGGDA